LKAVEVRGKVAAKGHAILMRPNIVFFLVDQWRGDCLGVLGHPVVQTPHLDGMAKSGVLFSAAYSSCPSCIASRASMFTGLSPSSHGRLGYQDKVTWRYEDMLPEVLAAAGYQTHCAGKTHFYPQRAHLGFQSMDSYESRQNFDGTYVNDYFEWLRERTGGLLEEHDHGLTTNSWVARPSHLPEELHNSSWTAAMAIRFLRRRDRTRPFFLNVSFHRPHAPLDPPQAFFDLYRDREVPPVPVGDWAAVHDVPIDSVDAWHGRLGPHELAQARRAYWAQITHIDSLIGRVMETLLREVRPGPTYIVFASDHGEMLGDHHLLRKSYAYEGSAKIPLIIRPPEGLAAQVCREPVVCEDIYPTILEMAGLAAARRTEGRSLLPLLGNPDYRPGREYVHGEHAAFFGPDSGMQFLTDGREKYVWFTLSGREQLFDLSKDPAETRDLAQDPRCAARLGCWRARMVETLAARPEDGLSDGKRLVPGKVLPAVREALTREGDAD
jgi:arylsulfatase